jgi:predicted lactoylglutathione lyase
MSQGEPSQAPTVQIEGVNPIFRVRNLAASIEYYTKKLGFKLNWRASEDFANVARGRCSIFLCEGDQGNFGTWLWVGVTDADALYEEYRASGAKIRHPPTNYQWAYEMQIEDLDGNILRLGSEPKEGQPIGDWLDMRGDTWTRTPEGGWTRVPRS